MGMAASQARYLALTARKTNTEYEGQQINQARTALANQSANLFNRLLNMEVPNPPKTTDYTEVQYSYSDGDGASVIDSWEKLSTANPDYNYIVNHYYYADIFTGAKKMLQDPQIQIGEALKEIQYKNDTADITCDATGVTVRYKIQQEPREIHYDKVTNAQVQGDESLRTALSSFASAKNLAVQDGVPVLDSIYGYKDSNDTWHFFLANTQETDYENITQQMVDNDQNNDLKPFLRINGYLDENDQLTKDYIYGNYDDSLQRWTFIEDEDSHTAGADLVARYEYSTVDNKDYSTVTGPTYVGNSKLTELSELIVNDQINQVAELSQILRDCPDSSVNQYLSFDAQGNLVYSGNGIYSFDMFGKTYYTTEADLQNSAGHPYDATKPIELQEKLAYYNASYINQKIEQKEYALLETDSNGRFKSVRFENDSIVYSLNTETVTNEAAYQDAMNRYLYEKEKYEKTIADINARTSIIQKEDRTLELRLKQLDTEQNALATEMDAVKKVIKDNVEKTFKTFSE